MEREKVMNNERNEKHEVVEVRPSIIGAKQRVHSSVNRRKFLQSGLAAGAGVAAVGLLPAEARDNKDNKNDQGQGNHGGIPSGDAAILRFLAAAEIIETDAWQQYNELGGIQDNEVPGGSGNAAYTAALAVLDEDMAQYIHDNT